MKREESGPEGARGQFGQELEAMRGELRTEIGWAPRSAIWTVPLVALAAGFVAGWGLKRSLPRPASGHLARRRVRR